MNEQFRQAIKDAVQKALSEGHSIIHRFGQPDEGEACPLAWAVFYATEQTNCYIDNAEKFFSIPKEEIWDFVAAFDGRKYYRLCDQHVDRQIPQDVLDFAEEILTLSEGPPLSVAMNAS